MGLIVGCTDRTGCCLVVRNRYNRSMDTADLFAAESTVSQPLANRMRPRSLEEYVGQGHILGDDKPLRRAILSGHLHSMILWGPPGTGKTLSLIHISEPTRR